MEENFSNLNAKKEVTYLEGKAKIGGLIFFHSNVHSLSLHEWIKNGCPSDTYISAYPDVLCVCRIPIVDADNDKGVLRKKIPSLPSELCSYRIPSYLLKKQKQITSQIEEVDGIICSHPKHLKNQKFHR